jgi:hypothetical protein
MNRRVLGALVAAAAALLAPAVLADDKKPPQMTPEQQAEMEAYMKAGTPGPQHQAMAGMVGTWSMLVKSFAPGAPPQESTGTAVRKMTLEGRVLVEEVEASMMGMPFKGHGMRGYDNVSGKYWSTWTDSMSTGIMLSEGTCDGTTCTFTGSWNDPVKKGPVTARMTVRHVSPTVEVFEMYYPGPDGKEAKMMEITYTKK